MHVQEALEATITEVSLAAAAAETWDLTVQWVGEEVTTTSEASTLPRLNTYETSFHEEGLDLSYCDILVA